VCSGDSRRKLKDSNADYLKIERWGVRIGVNLGDVIEDGEQILGMELILQPVWRAYQRQEAIWHLFWNCFLTKLGISWSLDMNILVNKP